MGPHPLADSALPRDGGPRAFIRPMGKPDAVFAASMHAKYIESGFLSGLGVPFLTWLYRAISGCRSGFGFVWEGPGGEILGYIACAESTGRLIREAMLGWGVLLLLALGLRVLRPSVLKGLVEAWSYPKRAAVGLPPAGVLSMAVSETARGKGGGGP